MLGERTILEALGLLEPETQKGNDQMNLMTPVTEQELAEKSTAPRVTHDQIEALIDNEYYLTHPELGTLTICVLVLTNGFTVTGESACADPSNFNVEIGQRIARENAKRQIWSLLGFELRTKLDMVEKAPAKSSPQMTTHVGTKVIHALPMDREEYNNLRGWDLPADENGSDEGYLVEYADGGDANVAGFAGYVSWSPKAVFDRAYGAPLR